VSILAGNEESECSQFVAETVLSGERSVTICIVRGLNKSSMNSVGYTSVFSDGLSRIWPHLLYLVTYDNVGQVPRDLLFGS